MRGTHGLAYALLILFVLACRCPLPTNQPSINSSDGNSQTHRTGEIVRIGYMQYQVHGSRFSDRFSDNEFLNQPPDAMYLIVDLSVTNTDNEERTVSPFKLVDENGAEYGTSYRAFMAEGGMGLIPSLNPNVTRRANLIFDVPQNRIYRLRVSGGNWSTDEALIALMPAPHPTGGRGENRRRQ